MEDEYEQRIGDLKSDLAELKSNLTEVETRAREKDRERANLLGQLGEQGSKS
jgi:uncharacterized protein YydD (DUF2326 family)